MMMSGDICPFCKSDQTQIESEDPDIHYCWNCGKKFFISDMKPLRYRKVPPQLLGFEIHGSEFLVGKVKAVCFISLQKIVIPIEMMKIESDELMAWLNSLTRDERLILE